jgi:biotin carboxylase
VTTTLVIGGVAPRSAGYGYDISHRALDQLRRRGTRIVLTDRQANLDAVPELVELADEAVALDFADVAACAAWAREQPRRFDAVVGFREYAVESVAACAEILGVVGNTLATVERVRTKDRCREHLRRHGYRQPRVVVCERPADAEELLAQAGRVVVKPRAKSNSEGVSVVTAAGDLPAAFAAAGAHEAPVLAETWVEGEELSVEGLVVAATPVVLAVTRKHLAPGTFIEVGHTMPAELDPVAGREVEDAVTGALTALGVRTGPFHVELWVGPDGVTLGEVHVRQGGDWIHAMLEWCRPGLELYGCWLDDLLGERPELPPATRGAAARFLVPPPGTVGAVRGWDRIAAAPGVLAAECAIAPGETYGVAVSNVDRRGSVVVGAGDAAGAAALADALVASLEVEPQ